MQHHRTSRATLAALTLAVLGLVMAGFVAPAGAASSTGRITGVVSIDGKPLKNAKVQLYRHRNTTRNDDLGFDRAKTVSTDKKGRYSFTGVNAAFDKKYGGPSYRYIVLTTDRSGVAAKARRFVTVKKGRTAKLDVPMARAVTVSGVVTRSDGGSPAELTVELSSNETRYGDEPENPDLFIDTKTTVRADGTFTLKGQAAGWYTILVRGDAYENHCYDFTANAMQACDGRASQDVVLTAGERRVLASSVVTELAPPVSRITGTVTDTSGRPLKGISVSVSPDNRGGTPLLTRSNGRFTLKKRLAPGAYAIRYEDPKNVWGTQIRGGGSGHTSSQIIVDADGVTARGIDTKLKSSTANRVTWTSGKGSITMTMSLKRRVSGGRPGGTMTITADGRSATSVVEKGKVTVRLAGLSAGRHSVRAVYSGTSNTAGFTRNFSPK